MTFHIILYVVILLGVDGVKWEDWVDSSSQLEAVGNLAAHVHITSTELLLRGKSYGYDARRVGHLISPQTFVECLKMTTNLAVQMKREEQVHSYTA